jgi:hypothetical protein
VLEVLEELGPRCWAKTLIFTYTQYAGNAKRNETVLKKPLQKQKVVFGFPDNTRDLGGGTYIFSRREFLGPR